MTREKKVNNRNVASETNVLNIISQYNILTFQKCTYIQGVTWCYKVLRCVTWCYTVLHDVARCYKMFHDVTWCYMVLNGYCLVTSA